MKTIQLIIAPNGQVRLETKGYSGSACVEASRFLEASLGKQLSETKTAGYHEVTDHCQNRIQEET